MFDSFLANASFTAFAKKHRILTALVFPLLFFVLYLCAGYLFAYTMPYVDRVTISIVLDLMMASLLVLYCGAIALHIPDIHKYSIMSRPVFWVVTICLIVIVLIVGQGASSLVMMLEPDNGLAQYSAAKANSSFFAQCFLTIICAPIFEEMMFRKCLYGSFSRLMPPVVAAVISSAIFAFGHGTLAHLPMTFMLGMLNCWLYARLGRIIVPIVVHFIHNAIACFIGDMIYFPDIFSQVIPVTIMYGVCVGILVCLLLAQPKAIAGYNVLSDEVVGSDIYDNRGYEERIDDHFFEGKRMADEFGGGVLDEPREVSQEHDV